MEKKNEKTVGFFRTLSNFVAQNSNFDRHFNIF